MLGQELVHGEEVREDDMGTGYDAKNLEDEGEVDHQAVDNSPLGGRTGKEVGLEEGVAGEGGTEEEEGGNS